jgi:hypothetical protein
MADELAFVKVGVCLRDRIKELSDTELRVLVALGLRINNERRCWPGMKVLMEECSRSERMIQYALNGLYQKGFVHIGQRVGGRGKPAVYTLNGYFAYGEERVQLIAPLDETLQSIAPFNDEKGAISKQKRVQSGAKRVQSPQKFDEPKSKLPEKRQEEPIEEEGPVEEARTPDAGASGASPQTQDATKASPFKEALRAVSDAKNKPTTLFDIVRKKFPDYNWDARASPKSWIGRCGQLLKTFGIRKVLEAFWLTETQAREGDPVSYAQAILIAKGKIPGRGEATQHDFRKW